MSTGVEYKVNNFLTITKVTSKPTTVEYIVENLKSSKEHCIINEKNIITKKIDEYGFPSDIINQYLSENEEKVAMTGSFLLHALLNEPKWKPGDIDIFIHDTQGYGYFNKGEFMYKDLENMLNGDIEDEEDKYVFTKVPHNKTTYSTVYIEDIFECKSKSNPKHKLQIINVNESVLNVIDSFDFDIIKLWYNGKQMFIPQKTIEMINSKKIDMPTQFVTMNDLCREIKRYDKYRRRDFTFNDVPIITLHVPYNKLESSVLDHDYIAAPSDDEDEIYDDKLKLEQATVKKLESQISQLESRNESIKTAISTEEKADYEIKLKKCKNTIVDLEEGISELEGEVCEFVGKNKSLQDEIEEIEEENDKFEETIQKLEEENRALKAKLDAALKN